MLISGRRTNEDNKKVYYLSNCIFPNTNYCSRSNLYLLLERYKSQGVPEQFRPDIN